MSGSETPQEEKTMDYSLISGSIRRIIDTKLFSLDECKEVEVFYCNDEQVGCIIIAVGGVQAYKIPTAKQQTLFE